MCVYVCIWSPQHSCRQGCSGPIPTQHPWGEDGGRGPHPASLAGGFQVGDRCTKGVLGPGLQDTATLGWSSSCRPFPSACCLSERSVPQFPSWVGRRSIPWASRSGGGCALREEGWSRARCSWEICRWGKAELGDVTDIYTLQKMSDPGWWYPRCCRSCGTVPLRESIILVAPSPSPPPPAFLQPSIPLPEHPFGQASP